MNLFQSVNNAMGIALETDETAGSPSLPFLHCFLSSLFPLNLSHGGTVEEQLCWAEDGGSAIEVLALLKGNPDLDVNWPNKEEWNRTALHIAYWSGHAEVSNSFWHTQTLMSMRGPAGDELPFYLLASTAMRM